MFSYRFSHENVIIPASWKKSVQKGYMKEAKDSWSLASRLRPKRFYHNVFYIYAVIIFSFFSFFHQVACDVIPAIYFAKIRIILQLYIHVCVCVCVSHARARARIYICADYKYLQVEKHLRIYYYNPVFTRQLYITPGVILTNVIMWSDQTRKNIIYKSIICKSSEIKLTKKRFISYFFLTCGYTNSENFLSSNWFIKRRAPLATAVLQFSRCENRKGIYFISREIPAEWGYTVRKGGAGG